jgi:hypothetical protein
VINIKDNQVWTPLMQAVLYCSSHNTRPHKNIVATLLEVEGVDLYTKDSMGRGLLEAARMREGGEGEIYKMIEEKQDQVKKQLWHGILHHMGVGMRSRSKGYYK